MGTWLATVHFPDGTRLYARYSTVVGALVSGLYPAATDDGYRAEVAGEPIPARPDAPPGEPVPVVIGYAPDDHRWHALADPSRGILLGPASPYHVHRLQEACELHEDDQGVRHLRRGTGLAECGSAVREEAMPYHRGWGGDDVPDIDLFAEWGRPDLCRPCLIAQLADDLRVG